MLRPLISYCLIAILVCAVGCDRGRTVKKKTDRQEATLVKLVPVGETEIQRTSTQPATVHPYFRTEIRAKATGFVQDLKVDIGTPVTKGDVLAILAVPEMDKRKDVIEAKIRRFQAEELRFDSAIGLAKAEVESAEALVVEAEAQLGSIEASVSAAEAEFKRTEELVTNGSIEDRVLDEVRKKRDSQRALKQGTLSSIESARAQVVVAKAKLAAAEADVKAASANTQVTKSELEELAELINYATLNAPFDGIVTERNIEPGQLVSQDGHGSSNPLFVVSQVSKVRVRIPVPESDAPYVNPGDEITLTFPSFASESVTGTVSRTSGSLDPSTRTMIAECDVENANGKLIPGMFGHASIALTSKTMANTLPSRAIRFDESGNAYVYAVSDSGTVSIANIETGHDDGNTIEVVAGIDPGQQVIDAHIERFADGQKVRPL